METKFQRWTNIFVALLLLATALVGIRLWPHPPLSTHAPSSTAVYDDHGKLLRLTLSSDDKYRVWVPLEDMPSTLIEGVKLHEDQWFYYHPGFNPISLMRGAWVTYVRHGDRQGGSTLTMQLARLMYRLNTRNPIGKFKQVLRAIELELRYSKHDILEAYLNYAPYGRNIEGVGAASQIYFDKPVDQLSLPEVLTLAVIPQDPTRRMREPSTVAGATSQTQISQSLTVARNRLYRAWLVKHPDDISRSSMFRLPLALRAPQRLPFSAPHAVEQVLVESRITGNTPPIITTTIDRVLQETLERQVREYITRQQERGIRNAAALLVDTRDLGVKALVGSANYFDASISGQVNGATAKRSPGSTLKPFIYALGMDQGVLHPRTILRDVPTSFGPFTPENFDGRFLGPVTATEALIRSRNIPAVTIASRLANPSLYEFLQAAGISRMASESHYGLALVLGGGEVSMEELATLYAMLANRGILKPLRFRSDDSTLKKGMQLLSEEASFMTLDMLRQNPRPDDAVTSQPTRLPVSWKTGTSWGFHDAWSAGVFGPYVLIVWVGNFDGSANPAFVGAEAAAPLFFRIIDSLQAQDPHLAEPAWRVPSHLKQVEVCLASGDLPNAWCPQRGSTWFIPGKSPIRVSNVHRPVVIDTRTGQAACPPYDPTHTRTEIFEFWSSDLAKVFTQAGIPRRKPPAANCVDIAEDGDPPRITSPLRGTTYTLRQNRNDQDHVAFTATIDASVRNLYWFVDDGYVGRSAPGAVLYWQPIGIGEHTVRIVDDHGRADTRPLRVTVVE